MHSTYFETIHDHWIGLINLIVCVFSIMSFLTWFFRIFFSQYLITYKKRWMKSSFHLYFIFSNPYDASGNSDSKNRKTFIAVTLSIFISQTKPKCWCISHNNKASFVEIRHSFTTNLASLLNNRRWCVVWMATVWQRTVHPLLML